jgi:hypothetical protein
VIQALIGAGHPLPSILGYTLDQVAWWTAAIDRQAARGQARAIVAARAAWADGKDVADLLRALEGS